MTQTQVDHCLQCDYPLTGLATPRCPECGRPFNPADPRTRNTSGRPIGPWRRRLLALPAWPLALLAAILLPIQLWAERFPLRPRLHDLHALQLAWILILLAWSILAAAPWVMRKMNTPRRGGWGFWATPALLVLAIVASTQSWSFRARFALSQPALTDFVNEAQAAYPIARMQGRPIGFFKPCSILTTRRTLVLRMPSADSWFDLFIYSPDGPPMGYPGQLRPLPAKNWYFIHGDTFSYVHVVSPSDTVALDLFRTGDTRPQAIAFLFDELADGFIMEGVRFSYHGPNRLAEPFGHIDPSMMAITRLGSAAVPELTLALRRKDWTDPKAAKVGPDQYLATLGLLDAAAAPAAADIALYLKDPNPNVRTTAAWALGRIGTEARPQLSALWGAFADTDPLVRENAAFAIQSIAPDPRSSAPGIMLRWRKTITAYDEQAAAGKSAIDLDAPARRLLVTLILSAGGEASSIAPDIAGIITESVEYLRTHPAQKNSGPDTADARALARTMREQAIIDGAAMLQSIGPFARDQATPLTRALDTLVKERIAAGADTVALTEPLAAALFRISPQNPTITAVLMNYINQSRNGAVVDPKDTTNDARDRPGYLRRQEFARLLQVYDPQNAAVRAQLRRDFRAAVNAPERRWAIDISAGTGIALPPEELVPVLRDMIATGDDRALDVAAQAAARLGPAARALAPALIARIDAAPAPCTSVRSAIAALPKIDPDARTVGECLLRALRKNSQDAPAAIAALHTAADAIIPALLGPEEKLLPDPLATLAALGPYAKSAVPTLIPRLAPPPNDARATLNVLAAIGPAAAAALPALLPHADPSDTTDTPARQALIQITTRQLPDDTLATLLAGPYRNLILTHGGNDPRLLTALLKDTALNDTRRAERILTLAADHPLPFDTLARYLPPPDAADTLQPSAVAAILKSTGPAASKIKPLTARLNTAQSPATQIAIANALVSLHATDAPTRDALLLTAYGSNIQLVRTAAFAALDKLFPGTREAPPTTEK